MANRTVQTALEISLEGVDPPKEFRLFKAGANETTKGVFLFDEVSCKEVPAAVANWGNDFAVDYGHAMVDPAPLDPAQAGIAAGWFKPTLRDGELWAMNVRWTERALGYLRAKEYRYISPFFEVDKEGRVMRFINVALTNIPATYNLTPLVPASQVDKKDNKTMKTKKKLSTGAQVEEPKAMEEAAPEPAVGASMGETMLAKAYEIQNLMGEEASAEDMAKGRKVLSQLIAMIAEMAAAEEEPEVEMEDKGKDGKEDKEKEKDPMALSFRMQAAAFPHLTAQVEKLSAQVRAYAAKEADAERNTVLASHRSRGALTPAMEADKAFMDDLAPLAPKALDRLLSKLPGLKTGAPVRTRTPGVGLSALEKQFSERLGISEEAYKALDTTPQDTGE
jgi:phage I-like protein